MTRSLVRGAFWAATLLLLFIAAHVPAALIA